MSNLSEKIKPLGNRVLIQRHKAPPQKVASSYQIRPKKNQKKAQSLLLVPEKSMTKGKENYCKSKLATASCSALIQAQK